MDAPYLLLVTLLPLTHCLRCFLLLSSPTAHRYPRKSIGISK